MCEDDRVMKILTLQIHAGRHLPYVPKSIVGLGLSYLIYRIYIPAGSK